MHKIYLLIFNVIPLLIIYLTLITLRKISIILHKIRFVTLTLLIIFTIYISPAYFEYKGTQSFNRSKYDSALNDWEIGLMLSQTLGLKETASGFMSNIGLAYAEKSQYSKALEYYYQALDISNEKTKSSIFTNMGSAYWSMGQYDKSLEYYDKSLKIKRDIGEERGIAIALTGMANIYQSLGKYDKALTLYKEALSIHKKTNDYKVMASIFNNIGVIYKLQKQHDEAIKYINLGLLNYQKYGNKKYEANTLHNLASLYGRKGDGVKELETYMKALEIHIQLNNRTETAVGLMNIAIIYYSNRDLLKARNIYLEALTILIQTGEPEYLWQIFNSIHLVSKQLKNPNAAIFYGKQAVNTIQTLRSHVAKLDDKSLSQSFMHDKKDVYEDLADLLMRQGRLFEAQKVLELLKQEEYFDFIRRTRAFELPEDSLRFTPPEQPRFERYQAIAQQLVSLGGVYGALRDKKRRGMNLNAQEEQRLQTLSEDLAAAEQALQAWFAQTDKLLGSLKPEDMQATLAAFDDRREQLRALLQDLGKGTVLLYFVPLPERLDILVTTAEVTVRRSVEVKREDLGKAVLDLREALKLAGRKRGWNVAVTEPPPSTGSGNGSAADLTAVKQPAKQLYDWLIAPIGEDLRRAEAQVLMVYLAGEMRYLPLAALYDGQRWLAEDYALATYTAAADAHLSKTRQAAWEVAGLGVTQKHGHFAPLPAVKDELEGIVRRNAQDKDGVLPGEVHLDAAFTENTLQDVLLRGFPVLHIASHFNLQVGKDTDSFLLLGDGNHLSLADIGVKRFEWQGLDMLALSACNTGMGFTAGSKADGTEVEGLGTLVINRGAKSVLATLWQVSDQSTAEFMQRLYAQQADSPVNKAKAIQQVQQAFIDAENSNLPDYYAHPFHWAAFILMGNWL